MRVTYTVAPGPTAAFGKVEISGLKSVWSDFVFFFFNDTATTEIYTLSLHDALPIFGERFRRRTTPYFTDSLRQPSRSEEHTSELQSRENLVCRLLLEKKKKNK